MHNEREMAAGTDKNFETFSARTRPGTDKLFSGTIPKGHQKGHVVEVMVDLWVNLPERVRLDLITGEQRSDLPSLIRRIVQEELAGEQSPGERPPQDPARTTTPKRK
ncbi:MAG: hypothetical protein LLG01_00840 [Planctomycetaceae bacterium]|nr:hypothetical protein [Planctomycetaceae bacterium]